MSEQDQNDGQEKSLDPSPGRLEKARRDGDVAQSKEATAALSYLGLFLCVILTGGVTGITFITEFLPFFHDPLSVSALLYSDDVPLYETVLAKIGGPGLLFLFAPALGVFISIVAQRAVTFAPKKIKPKLSRISLIGGLKKKYGPEGLVEFAKSSAKLTIICVMFATMLAAQMGELPMRSRLPVVSLPMELQRQFVIFFGLTVLFSFAIAALDLPWAHFQHHKKLRMTREEAKKESKENEGDPTFKQKRQDRGRAIAENRMMLDVPDADIILVNPTHYAVALQWDREGRNAPVCIAKGVDEVAARIREAAALADVPIKSDPPTTRAIWASVEIGEEIKREHYKAVAAAIHFADRMRAKAKLA